MLHFFIVILIIQKVFSENEFPQNIAFYRFANVFNTNITIYNGSNMSIVKFEFNISNIKTIINCTNETITYRDNNNYTNIYNFTNKDYEFDQSYGEIIFVEYEILSYYLLFFGFLIVLYGSCYYILGIMFHISLVLYFFIKDFCELFCNFNSKNIPLFIFTGTIISGIVIYYIINSKEEQRKNKIIQIIYGSVLGYFLYKSLFYYIIFFTPLNKILYFIFLVFTVLAGCVVGCIINYLNAFMNFYFMICSIIPGSFYIIKGIGFIIGGYYSDILIIQYNIEYSEKISNEISRNYSKALNKIIFYLVLQILIIICAFIFQIFYYNKLKMIETLWSNSSNKNKSARSSLTYSSNRYSKPSTEGSDNSVLNKSRKDLSDITEGDNSNYINDQED